MKHSWKIVLLHDRAAWHESTHPAWLEGPMGEIHAAPTEAARSPGERRLEFPRKSSGLKTMWAGGRVDSRKATGG